MQINPQVFLLAVVLFNVAVTMSVGAVMWNKEKPYG